MTSNTAKTPPPITHILETCLYVKDIERATKFYNNVLGMEPFLTAPRMSGFALGNTTLLLFTLGETTTDTVSEAGTIPLHGPTPELLEALTPRDNQHSLRQHYCFAVESPDHVREWEKLLKAKDIDIISTMDWPRGGRSVYFRDPDGNIGEVGSRGIWSHYALDQ